MDSTNDLQRYQFVVSICELIDNNIMLWSDLIDGCGYMSQFEGKEWVVCCCDDSEKQRTLTIDKELSSLTKNDVMTVCESINKQKLRQASQRQVTMKALELIENYKKRGQQEGSNVN